MKPSESTSKHFVHCALEVWSALYPNKSFGFKNKNIISYFMVVMLYVELVLMRKVDWRLLLTRNKGDRMEYEEKDLLDNFSSFQQNVGIGFVLDVHGANQNTSRFTKTIHDEDSKGKKICFIKKQIQVCIRRSWILACQDWRGIFKM